MFTTPAFVFIKHEFIDKFPEVFTSLINKAKEIGYLDNTIPDVISLYKEKEIGTYVFTYKIDEEKYGIMSIGDYTATRTCYLKDKFDCGENIDMFLKIINIRDDTDLNQYFVLDEGTSWVNLGMWIEPGTLEKCLTEKKIECFNSLKSHKASAEEIFNFFNKYKDCKL